MSGVRSKSTKRRAEDASSNPSSDVARLPVQNVYSDDDENDDFGKNNRRASLKMVASAENRKKSNDFDMYDENDNGEGGEEEASGEGETPKKRRKTAKFKKHPDAPKRFRSAFIIFSQQRHKELRAKLNAEGRDIDTMNIAGQISDEWRTLGSGSKKKWEEMAREDKERYQREKATYAGPWKVRTNLRKPKDPNSPKKPVPAYFAFSNERRQEVKNQNPHATNGEISRILSKMWKDAPEEVRRMYLDREAREREKYAEKMVEWKEKQKQEVHESGENAEDGHKESIATGISRSGTGAYPLVTSSIPYGMMAGGHIGSGMFATQNQGTNFQDTDSRSNHPSSSGQRIQEPQSSFSGPPSLGDAIRMFQDSSSQFPQNVLDTSQFQQTSQNTGNLNQDLLTRLLSNMQAPQVTQQQNTGGDDKLIQQVLLAALQQQQPPPAAQPINYGDQGTGPGLLGGQWMGNGTGSAPMQGGNNHPFGQGQMSNEGSAIGSSLFPSTLQQTNPEPASSIDLLNLLNMQSNSRIGGTNQNDFTRSLQQNFGGSDSGNVATFQASGGNSGPDSSGLLLRLLGQQQQLQQYPNGSDPQTVSATSGTRTSSSSYSASNNQDPYVQSLLRQLAGSGGGGMPPPA